MLIYWNECVIDWIIDEYEYMIFFDIIVLFVGKVLSLIYILIDMVKLGNINFFFLFLILIF